MYIYNKAGLNKAGKKRKEYTINRHQLKRTNNTTYEQIKSTNQSPQHQNCNDCGKNAGWVSETLAAIFAAFST